MGRVNPQQRAAPHLSQKDPANVDSDSHRPTHLETALAASTSTVGEDLMRVSPESNHDKDNLKGKFESVGRSS